ncbi:MAG: ABC transporter permease [Acidobacteria bacterium]|nr:ABC transporter permease [Acidobacteriota bacterium]
MRWMGALLAVARKELVDGIRDRRSLATLVFSALMTPILLGVMLTSTAGSARGAEELTLPVVGAEHAPAFVQWLGQQTGVKVVPGPADPEQAVLDRVEDVVLIIESDFMTRMGRAQTADVKLVSESTRERARPKIARVRALVGGYAGQLASLRLIARGVAPGIAQPIRLEDVEVSSSQARLATLLSFLPLLLVIAGLVGGMQIAIDSTAGERERGSLEPLLLNPVPRWVLASGKWLAASALGCVSVVFSMIITVNVLRRIPWHDLGIRFRVSDGELFSLLLLILPLALFLAAMVLFASTFARSFKEAQGYLGMLMLLPMLPGMLATFYPLSRRPWLAPVPVLGQYALASDVLGGQPPGAWLFLVAGVSALGCALLLVGLTARAMGRERIIFGR